MNAEQDQWREIPGFSAYEVSGAGAVRRRTAAASGYRLDGRKVGDAVAGHIDRDGYRRFRLIADDGSRKKRGGHYLVLLAFKGPPPTKHHLPAHWDGVRTNNTLGNLRWATAFENSADMRRHGTWAHGERQGLAKLTEEQVLAVRRGYTGRRGDLRVLAEAHGVQIQTIWQAITGRTWKHLPMGNHSGPARTTPAEAR